MAEWTVAAFVLSGLGLVLVALVWPQAHPTVVEDDRDAVDIQCDDLEAIIRGGRDYHGSRAAVVREMEGLWVVWLDGHPHERTARSPAQARSMVETHLRTVRRGGGRAVGRPHPARTTRPDWRRDLAP